MSRCPGVQVTTFQGSETELVSQQTPLGVLVSFIFNSWLKNWSWNWVFPSEGSSLLLPCPCWTVVMWSICRHPHHVYHEALRVITELRAQSFHSPSCFVCPGLLVSTLTLAYIHFIKLFLVFSSPTHVPTFFQRTCGSYFSLRRPDSLDFTVSPNWDGI